MSSVIYKLIFNYRKPAIIMQLFDVGSATFGCGNFLLGLNW